MLIGEVLRAPTNGATLPLLTSCIVASEKFKTHEQCGSAIGLHLMQNPECTTQYS